MADNEKLIALALDTYNNRVKDFSKDDSLEVLRQELIKMNGNSTVLDYRSVRDGRCAGIFTILEEVIRRTNEQSYENSPLFDAIVDYRNIARGDKNEFIIPDDSLFVVSEIAEGTQGLRRQRLTGGTKVSVPTTPKGVKIYEELARILAGRIDFNEMITRLNRSFNYRVYSDIYAKIQALSSTELGSSYIDTSGTYTEGTLLNLINHVEAESNSPATIFGTRTALSKITVDAVASASDQAKADKYSGWYFNSFHGTNMIAFPNLHVPGSSTFVMDDDKVYVWAGGNKPIKFVNEGTSLIIAGNPMDNADLTQEYLYTENYGIGVAVTDKLAVYDLA